MFNDPISRIRRFSRTVTAEVGALDASFLNRGRPLGVARVLNAIGHGMNDVADLRSTLGLDSGLMSRYLRGLEDEGLIETKPGPEDARRRLAHLTNAGQTEFQAYEALSDERAETILSRLRGNEDLLAEMDRISLALAREKTRISIAAPNSAAAKHCLAQYFDELDERFNQSFDRKNSRAPDADQLVPPDGAFLLAQSDDLPVGCVMLKTLEPGIGEVKRLWVDPRARGMGLAKRLMKELEDRARDIGLTRLRLDTNSALPEAIDLYRKDGWYEIDRYNDDPNPDLFFEKTL